MNKLNSFNEWDPLKEIIVGNTKNYILHDRDLFLDIFYHENLAKTFKKLDINVLPLELPPFNSSKIEGWEAVPIPPLNIRDNILILDNETIEAPSAIRSCYLETRLSIHIFQKYSQSGVRWSTVPSPTLMNCSFDLFYTQSTKSTMEGLTDPIKDLGSSPYDTRYEMMFDGIQVLRLGKDLVINIANENHKLAVDWLESHVQDVFRIHKVYKMSDNHIDSIILASRPSVFLVRYDEGLRDLMPTQFQNWKYIVLLPASGAFPIYNQDDSVLTSPYIDLNVLSINPDTVLVNRDCTDLIEILEQKGFNVVLNIEIVGYLEENFTVLH